MVKFITWIKHHQVVTVFVITFAINWGLGFSYGAVMKRNQLLLFQLVFGSWLRLFWHQFEHCTR